MRFYILALLFVFVSAGPLSADEDWGYSHNFLIRKKVNDKFSIISRSLFTSREDMRDVFFGTVDLGFDYDIKKWFRAGMAYRGAWFRRDTGFAYENRPLINLQFQKKIKGYFISNRSRFEFRYYRDDRDDDVRYRNETRIIFPIELTRFKFKPYIEEEFFYGFNADEINANWLSAGLRYKVNDNLNVKFGYRWLTQKFGSKWQDRNVFVTGFIFNF